MRFFNRQRDQLLQQQVLYGRLLTEKDARIALLERQLDRAESRAVRLELAANPRLAARPAGHPLKAAIRPESSWLTYLQNHMKEQEQLEAQAKEQANGVSREGRQSVDEPSNGKTTRSADASAGGERPTT
jgi:hypothetical protein